MGAGVIVGIVAAVAAAMYFIAMYWLMTHCPYVCGKCGHFGPGPVCENCGYDPRESIAAISWDLTGNVAREHADKEGNGR
jgi:hypothetical protein